ncbi:MAG: Tn3 family transposase [Pseudonocardiales bacterium]|nr:Tn3 family transposase [Pseudonocardiales bacterium]
MTTSAAVLTAQALNVGWGPVVTPGMEALTRSRIGHVYQNYVRAENHARANAALITGQAGIATAELWGGGLVAAVDGTRFVVPVRSIDARPNPKYFGRKKGVTLLNMIFRAELQQMQHWSRTTHAEDMQFVRALPC